MTRGVATSSGLRSHLTPVVALNEWYRLRKSRGSPRTRDTYLAMLCPFLGFLLEHEYQWNAEPDVMREYTRQYLIASGCVVRPAWQTDGYHVALTNATTMSPSGLALFIAAARDFYATLIEGEWDPSLDCRVTYYAHPNPMYSEMLLRWKREHLRALANAAPRCGGYSWRIPEPHRLSNRLGTSGASVTSGIRPSRVRRRSFAF